LTGTPLSLLDIMVMETSWERESRLKGVTVKRKTARIVGVVLIIAGLFFLYAFSRSQLRLIIFGTKSTGEVVAYERTPSKRRSRPVIRVTIENGETIEFRGVSLKNDGLKIGDVVPVYYLAYEPSFGETATFRRFWLAVITIIPLIVVSLGGGLWLLRYARDL
jgi:hypothetical protein